MECLFVGVSTSIWHHSTFKKEKGFSQYNVLSNKSLVFFSMHYKLHNDITNAIIKIVAMHDCVML